MDPDYVSAMGTVLHSKMSQVNTITEKYKDAYNLLETTTDEYVFLQLLLQQVHPLLSIKNSATMDIPTYSSYNDLYRYAKELIYFVKTHGLHQRYYTPEETTQMYLTHLNNPKFDDAVQLCQNAIYGSVIMSAEYLVPAISGTIDLLRT